jgi:hypothetical protein
MKTRRLITAAVAAGVLATGLCATASAAGIQPGVYCSRERLDTSSGDDLGVFRADADIRRTASGLTISFTDSFPDSGQVLETGRVSLSPGPGGKQSFRFTDNWNAKAVGAVKATRAGIHIDIDRTSDAGDGVGDNAGRNYGGFDLKRGPCRKAR